MHLFSAGLHAVSTLRILLAHHPWVHWTLIACAAVGAGLVVGSEVDELAAEREAWGRTRPVLVATEDLVPDGPLAITSVERPLAAVPPEALAELPAGARLHQRVATGEVLVDVDLVATDGPARHAAEGTVVVGLVDPFAPTVAVGQRVQVVADGLVLAADATVVDVVADVTFVAVPPAAGAAVASSARAGSASLLFVP